MGMMSFVKSSHIKTAARLCMNYYDNVYFISKDSIIISEIS